MKASCDNEREAWRQGYDRLKAAAEPTLFPCWGKINPSLWTQHFSPNTLHHLWEQKTQEMSESTTSGSEHRPRPYPAGIPVCKRSNWGTAGCNPDRCNFRHICASCSGDYQAKLCAKQAEIRKELSDMKGERSGEHSPLRP